MSEPENPPAFPNAMIPEWQEGSSGMSLRDWFAGQVAATALYHAISQVDDPHCMMLQDQIPEEWAAKIAYGLADAMLAARVQS